MVRFRCLKLGYSHLVAGLRLTEQSKIQDHGTGLGRMDWYLHVHHCNIFYYWLCVGNGELDRHCSYHQSYWLGSHKCSVAYTGRCLILPTASRNRARSNESCGQRKATRGILKKHRFEDKTKT